MSTHNIMALIPTPIIIPDETHVFTQSLPSSDLSPDFKGISYYTDKIQSQIQLQINWPESAGTPPAPAGSPAAASTSDLVPHNYMHAIYSNVHDLWDLVSGILDYESDDDDYWNSLTQEQFDSIVNIRQRHHVWRQTYAH